MNQADSSHLGWLGIMRLGLVQTALGSIVVLMSSTINRVMVVELALPAVVPGALIGLHYAVQALRPRWGYGSDMGGRRTPWIIGGMATLALGGTGAAAATALAATNPAAGIALAVFCFCLIGIGVGAAGTSLLALLATQVEPRRRGSAAATVWIMMIAGFAVTAKAAGSFLDPFSPERLVAVTAVVCVAAVLLATCAIWNVETSGPRAAPDGAAAAVKPPFLDALREVWSDPAARRFTIFVFVSMVAYNAQELVLEPFSGLIFGLTPGASTKLSGDQHGGVLAGMLFVSFVTYIAAARPWGSLRLWTTLGCVASALPMAGLAFSAYAGPGFPLRTTVFALGFSNGVFAAAAIGSMMALAHAGPKGRAGTRMGLWGAAQAFGFGLGGFGGTVAVDVARQILPSAGAAYSLLFLLEAALFLFSAVLAASLGAPATGRSGTSQALSVARSAGGAS